MRCSNFSTPNLRLLLDSKHFTIKKERSTSHEFNAASSPGEYSSWSVEISTFRIFEISTTLAHCKGFSPALSFVLTAAPFSLGQLDAVFLRLSNALTASLSFIPCVSRIFMSFGRNSKVRKGLLKH